MGENTICTARKEDILTTPARKIVFECLAKGLNIKQASAEAGVSYKYARNWVAKSGIKALVLHETALKTEDLREKASRKLWEIVDDPNTSQSICIKALDTLGKMNGWHSATMNLETPQRQRELTEIERQEAQRLALIRFKALPGGFIDTNPPSGVYEKEEMTGKKIVNSVETTPEQSEE